MNQYADYLRNLFNDKAILYSAGENRFVALFKEMDKEKVFNSFQKHILDLKSKNFLIEENEVTTKTFLALIELSKEEMINSNISIPQIEANIRKIKYNKNQFISTNLKEICEKITQNNKNLLFLKQAIKADRLVPFFQPLVDIKTKKILKYEVLMRIIDGKDYLAPYPFIILAEKNNLIETIDLIMLEKALKYKCKVDKEDKLIFSFNLSGQMTNSTNYLYKANSIVDNYGIKHENIIFEITETENIENLDKFTSIINKFKELKYQFAIDDFGVGFSSISYLKNVPADYLKIDGSFIRDINEKEQNLYLVKSIVNMARGFNMKTVAEFVETKEILDQVESLGIDYAQGYYIDKPCKDIKIEKNI
jgi:EAL domain-containing protein (putative c-di-GMP-specific phosphodiesterase class I)